MGGCTESGYLFMVSFWIHRFHRPTGPPCIPAPGTHTVTLHAHWLMGSYLGVPESKCLVPTSVESLVLAPKVGVEAGQNTPVCAKIYEGGKYLKLAAKGGTTATNLGTKGTTTPTNHLATT